MKNLTALTANVKKNSSRFRSPRYYVGIDVHRLKCAIAVSNGEEIEMDWTTDSSNASVINSLKPLKEIIKGIVYEAGPTGFGLARALAKNGYPVQVAAPALIPREPAKTNKTDRLDAAKLAQYLGKGVITNFVTIPGEDEEDKRHLVRTLEQCKADKNAAKHRIKSFLLSQGVRYADSWSKTSRDKMLDSVHGENAGYALKKKFEALEFAEKLVHEVQKKIREIVKADEELSKRVKILKSHPGVGEDTAAAFALEMFPSRKFKNANQVGSFLGLAPQVWSSGESEKRGSIIKKGREELRRLLVQCAWRWVMVEKAGRKKFEALRKNTGSARKAIVAMTRRLGIHLWKMLETGTCYNAKLYANAIKSK
jgi:transposase